MKIKRTKFKGLYIINTESKTDSRGSFTRSFCKNELGSAGIKFDIAQIDISHTKGKGTIRGMHLQVKPKEEDKIVQCIQGKIYDVAIDLRKLSKTYGKWLAIELTEEDSTMVLIPKGVAHGFQLLSDEGQVLYFTSAFYTPETEKGVRWNDSFFGINWPLPPKNVSYKDQNWSDYK